MALRAGRFGLGSKSAPTSPPPMKNWQLVAIAIALALFAALSIGCGGRRAIPDQSIPHRLAKPATLTLWVRRADGRMVEERVAVPAGWWVAGPLVVGE